MITTLIDGKTPTAIDPKIYAFLLENPSYWGDDNEFIGIMNDAGEVYRMIAADGAHQAEDIIDGLTALGLVNRIGSEWRGNDAVLFDTATRKVVSGWNAVFQPKDGAVLPIPVLTSDLCDF